MPDLRRRRRVIPDPCHRCGGDGGCVRAADQRQIPAGVGDGMRVRLAAQGEVGPGGGPAGDLYVGVHEQARTSSLRDGDDLHCTVSVPMVDARWAPRSPSTPSWTAAPRITIAPGTQPGSVTTLRGHGMPPALGVRGNLHAHIEVVVPTKSSTRSRELLGELKTHGHDAAEIKSTHSAPTGNGGGLFSRLRETFSGR